MLTSILKLATLAGLASAVVGRITHDDDTGVHGASPYSSTTSSTAFTPLRLLQSQVRFLQTLSSLFNIASPTLDRAA